MSLVLSQFLLAIIFLTVFYLHISKKNYGAVVAYGIQSLAVVLILLGSFVETGRMSLLLVALLTFIVKVVLAPAFFSKLIKKNSLMFTVSSYLNLPLTMIVIAVLVSIAHSAKFATITSIIPENQALLVIALSVMLISLFLIVNRKGALSQIIGMLSFENSIIAFATYAGLEQSFILQIGIIFDIAVWLVIATVFVSLIYNHFGTLDVTSMTHSRD